MPSIKSTSEGGKILVIKDSYANCFVPFLTEHYSEIVMLDMRHVNIPLDEFLDINEFDSVLFLYNTVLFNNDINLRKLEEKLKIRYYAKECWLFFYFQIQLS